MDMITLAVIVKWATYWIAFWTVVNAILPPRETFKDFPGFLKFYNVLLSLVAYYGALNVRNFTVQLYGKLGVPLAGNIADAEKPKTPGE
jgi:hypothetical protein